MDGKILQQGAEAIILKENNFVIKNRIPKDYRIKELDEKIRKHRTKSEKKLLEKACKVIPVPNPLPLKEDYQIKMPLIEGEKLSEHLNDFSIKKQEEICKTIGENIAKIHKEDIIHGDLTTSNMILSNNEIYFIDFGLGTISQKIEDRAVDLHLLKQALEAKHFQNGEDLFDAVLKGYKNYKESKKVIERLKIIEKRGRYKF